MGLPLYRCYSRLNYNPLFKRDKFSKYHKTKITLVRANLVCYHFGLAVIYYCTQWWPHQQTFRELSFSLSSSTLSLQFEMQTFLGLVTHIDIEVSMSIIVTYQSTENTLCVCIYVAQNLNYGNYFII